MSKPTGSLLITAEERDLLQDLLRKTPIQGTVETLPKVMETMVSLLSKLENVVFVPSE